MRFLIANERFLFRFGLDRALLLIAGGLRSRGHHVTLLANRHDRAVTESAADRVIVAPADAPSYPALDDWSADWLDEHWSALFAEAGEPDVVLVGGWPFFGAIARLRARGVRVAFMDCGAVPLEGMEPGARHVQEILRAARRAGLPAADAIYAISDFIASTQSRPDAPGVPDIRTLLLGADHMAAGLWASGLVPAADGAAARVARAAAGRPVVLNLGRWEPGGYKNSHALFDLARRVRGHGVDALFAVLEEPAKLEVPPDLANQVLAIGFPDDAELHAITEQARAGLSLSRWEGFNLPLAETQFAGRPAFALDLAAHPEVSCSRAECLAPDEAALADRLARYLAKGFADETAFARRLAAFREDFSWRRVVERYALALESLAARPRAFLLLDTSNACRDGANSGVVRVTRRLGRELQSRAETRFAIWDAPSRRYAWPREEEYALLSAFNGPVVPAWLPRSPPGGRRPVHASPGAAPWLLFTETVMEVDAQVIRGEARAAGWRVGAIFYDAIPVLRPDLVADRRIRENHDRYMHGLAHTDLVMPISDFSARCLLEHWGSRRAGAPPVRACLLPGEFGSSARCRSPRRFPEGRPVELLCVSTLEPRKGHLVLLKAVRELARLAPGLDWRLTFVGNRYAGANSIAHAVGAAALADPRVRWLGIVDDTTLRGLYDSADIGLYGSTIEGFGMPIVESLWHGAPVVCHEDGVMGELAAEGGCLVADMNDPLAVAGAIARLATDRATFERLAREAAGRPMKTWDDYGRQIMDHIEGAPPRGPDAGWMDILYPACITDDWQMTDSERLGLTALLHRHRPRVAIEIGTYRGGSLSLIAQYARTVYSIDIDPSIPEKFGHFRNVRFLTGFSQDVVPPLMDELERQGIAIDFVLIDGDHSAEGVKRDIEIVTSRRPLAPMFVMLHDGFNPECRRGMLAARWADSPWVRWVDTDFIPGRVMEHGGAGTGEMWGGLACAFLSPEPRTGPLQVRTTAGAMQAELAATHYGSGS